MARSKTRKPRKSRKSRKFFPRFLNLSFRFCPTAKIENSEKRKLGIIFPRFPSFRFAIFDQVEIEIEIEILYLTSTTVENTKFHI